MINIPRPQFDPRSSGIPHPSSFIFSLGTHPSNSDKKDAVAGEEEYVKPQEVQEERMDTPPNSDDIFCVICGASEDGDRMIRCSNTKGNFFQCRDAVHKDCLKSTEDLTEEWFCSQECCDMDEEISRLMNDFAIPTSSTLQGRETTEVEALTKSRSTMANMSTLRATANGLFDLKRNKPLNHLSISSYIQNGHGISPGLHAGFVDTMEEMAKKCGLEGQKLEAFWN